MIIPSKAEKQNIFVRNFIKSFNISKYNFNLEYKTKALTYNKLIKPLYFYIVSFDQIFFLRIIELEV